MLSFPRDILSRFGVTIEPSTLLALEAAIQEIVRRSGWGKVELIIERGKVKRVVVQLSLELTVE